ncbi:hypothetical protein CMQ_6925 [Grosmannia clavigera kw1407]|uniref:NADH-ubiquinone reductase complex 1 MLRQ subunit n=1 Tax=Grosmannia clavigera (strain kw1407 / UAMH 11150) TaxID=655863 RepID=F0X7Y9_GROCL|nr:uncharacterized protein CMQ_6925 [Grosmannia clavigera kw1407]EFX06604.1 hypothetical protein CMQ_6925 [Grosmannia clavigera kw1407]
MYATRALRMFRPTLRMMRPVPKEEQAAHTVSQRLRRLKNIPAELLPLGVVVGFAVFAAGYSITRHLFVDKTIRLKRQNRLADNAAHGHEEHAEAAEHAEAVVEAKQ